jgi:hypothetical protein
MAIIVTDFTYGQGNDSNVDMEIIKVNNEFVLVIEGNVDRLEIELSENQFNKLVKTINDQSADDWLKDETR